MILFSGTRIFINGRKKICSYDYEVETLFVISKGIELYHISNSGRDSSIISRNKELQKIFYWGFGI